MGLPMEIEFDQLVGLVKKLSVRQQNKLKDIIEQFGKKKTKSQDLELFLLNGPVFSEKQFEKILETRNAINQWRTS